MRFYFLAKYVAIFLSVVLLVVANSLEYKWSSSWETANDSEDPPVIHTAFVQTGEELLFFNDPQCIEMKRKAKFKASLSGELHFMKPIPTFYVKERWREPQTASDPMPLEFDPPFLEFDDHPVAVPTRRKVIIRNILAEEITVDSVMGNSLMFHSEFVKPSEIPPRGKATFEVSFSPREVGTIVATLKISTSVGIFYYEVSGSSSSNPYRVSPYVGIRLSFNQTITKNIELFNPYSETLRVVSVVVGDEFCHAELPFNINRMLAPGSDYVFDIRPYQKKVIAKLSILGIVEDNSTAFIKVAGHVINDKGSILRHVNLLITQPYQIVDLPGVYGTSELLDFGILRIGERSSPQYFDVYQYRLNGKVEFETIYVDKGDATGLYMEFLKNPPISVYAGRTGKPGKSETLVKVVFDTAKMTFDDDKIPSKRLSAGRIFAITRGGNYNITLPYRAIIYQGELTPVANDLAIHFSLRPPHRRAVRMKNDLPFGIVIFNVTVAPDAKQYFTVRLFGKSVEIPEGQDREVFLLKYNKKVPDTFATAFIYLQTNTTTFRVQLTTYNGELEVQFFYPVEQYSDILDYGVMQKNDTKRIRFGLRNRNFAQLDVHSLSVPSKGFRLYHVGFVPLEENGVVDLHMADVNRTLWIQGRDLLIPPFNMAILDLELHSPGEAQKDDIKFSISTDFQSKVYRIQYELGKGMLEAIPDHINFGQAHPGKVIFRTLQIFNGFTEDMTVLSLSTMYRDPRFFFEYFDPSTPMVVRSGRLANLGRVVFMPDVYSLADWSYLGIRADAHDVDNDARWFIIGLGLPQNLAEIDGYLFRKFRNKFDKLVASGRHFVNTSVILHTDRAKNVEIPASAEMVWPRLLTRDSIHFPLTTVGNFTIMHLTLANPTKESIVVQVIPLAIHPNPDAAIKEFASHLITPLTSNVETNETLMFSLRDTELFTLKADTPVPKLREELEAAIQTTVPKFTLSFLLKPHMKVKMRLGFLPNDYNLKSTLIFIRNNLTMVEPVVVYGRGARIGMTVENLEARSRNPLLFEIRHDHLTDCNNPKRLTHKLSSTLTVRRPFMVANRGEVPFTISEMRINNIACENRGFRILNCYPFQLMPNETYALDVAYTPDFLSTVNDADLQLYMHMNGSSWTFPLAATVPADMLARCHRALPRPPFEPLMYYSCVIALVFCLICVLACAYLEGDRAITEGIHARFSKDTPTRFDLNARPGASVQEEPRTQQQAQRAPTKPNYLFRPSDEASFLIHVVFFFINLVMRVVHFFWQYYRSPTVDKEESKVVATSTGGKKKKRGNAGSSQAQLLQNHRPAPATRPSTPPVPEPAKVDGTGQKSQKDKGKTVGKKLQSQSPIAKSSSPGASPKMTVRHMPSIPEPDNDKLVKKAERLIDDEDGAERKLAAATKNVQTARKPIDPTPSSSRDSTPPALPRQPRHSPVSTEAKPKLQSTSRTPKEAQHPKQKVAATKRHPSPRTSRTVLTPPPPAVSKTSPVSAEKVESSRPPAIPTPPLLENVQGGSKTPTQVAPASVEEPVPQVQPIDFQQLQQQLQQMINPALIQSMLTMYPDMDINQILSQPVIPLLPPLVPPLLQPGIGVNIPGTEYDYGNQRPVTPTPSIASSFDVRSPELLSPQYSGPPTYTESRIRNDSDASGLSDHSGAPDWADAEIGEGNADDDFSAMHSATAVMADDFEDDPMELRRRRHPSASSIPTDPESAATSRSQLFAPPLRQESFSNWPVPNLGAFDLQPSEPTVPSRSVWDSAWEGELGSSTPGISSAQPSTGYDPLNSGLALGSIFSGNEFSMWSNNPSTSNHEISQSLFHLLNEADKSESKKKDK